MLEYSLCVSRLRRFQTFLVNFRLFVTASVASLALMQAGAVYAVEDLDAAAETRIEIRDMLGIGGTFGRWPGTVRLVYDPDGAPSQFTDSARVVELINESAGHWERVSGIKFELTGTDSAALDDGDADSKDGLVRIFWGAASGAAGLAGPSSDFENYNEDLGYYPYHDGTVEMSDQADTWDGNGTPETEFLVTMTHELGHLIGFGHSDNPSSIMYANPYNNLVYPRSDDIRAAQALYGFSSTEILPEQPVAAWQYTPLAAAPAATTEFLFKPNNFSNKAAHFVVGDGTDAVTAITSATADGQWIYLNSGGIKGSDGKALNLQATLVILDPFGYIYQERAWNLSCDAGFICGESFISIATSHVMKTIPGTWKVYVVDKAKAHTLLTTTLLVENTPSWNQAPLGTLTVEQGSKASEAIFTLTGTDEENHTITAIWHAPGPQQDLDNDFVWDDGIAQVLGSDGKAQQTIDFSLTGTHTFFIELKDDGPRYDGKAADSSVAGSGFQGILQVTVTLPVSESSLQVISSALGQTASGNTAPSAQVLTSVANTKTITNVREHKAGVSTAGFSMGASGDAGVSTGQAFTTSDTVLIAGRVEALTADVGSTIEAYAAIKSTINGQDSWRYIDSNGALTSWNGWVATLQPFKTINNASSGEELLVYNNTLEAGIHRVYFGYKRSPDGALMYTGSALRIDITE